jgi:hypothetical protein
MMPVAAGHLLSFDDQWSGIAVVAHLSRPPVMPSRPMVTEWISRRTLEVWVSTGATPMPKALPVPASGFGDICAEDMPLVPFCGGGVGGLVCSARDDAASQFVSRAR